MSTAALFKRQRFTGPVALARPPDVTETDGCIMGATADVFYGWQTSRASLALWQRTPSPEIAAALDSLDLAKVTGFRVGCDIPRLGAVLREAVADCGFDDARLARFLADDMELLTRHFAICTGPHSVEARMEVVWNDACRRFHLDSYPARLAVTYVGPGTVFAPRCHARQALEQGLDYRGPTFALPTFAAGLFAGNLPDREGAAHRSPVISGTGRGRLFFCVNAYRH